MRNVWGNQSVWWKHCCAVCFCWGVWQILCATSKGCHLPRDQQRQHSGDMMSPCHTHCEIRRCFYDASCACHGASCVSCACHFVSSFGGEEWQCRSDGRHFGHGALGCATDLRHRARPSSHRPTLWGRRRKGKNFWRKKEKVYQEKEKFESNVENCVSW